MHHVWRLLPLLSNVFLLSCLGVCISAAARGRLRNSHKYATFASVRDSTSCLAYVASHGTWNPFSNRAHVKCGLSYRDTDLAVDGGDTVAQQANGGSYKRYFGAYATKEPTAAKRRYFFSRRKKRSKKTTSKKGETASPDGSSNQAMNPSGGGTDSQSTDAPLRNADDISAVFVLGDQPSPLSPVNDDLLHALNVTKDDAKTSVISGYDVDKVGGSISGASVPSLGSGSSEQEGAAISKRRLHALQALFSDQHALKTSQIISMLYHLLGSVNTELTGMFGDIRDSEQVATSHSVDSGKTTEGDAVGDDTGLNDKFGGISNTDNINKDHALLDSPSEPSTTDYDDLKWPFEEESGIEGGSHTLEDSEGVTGPLGKDHWDDLTTDNSNLSRKDMRQLKHLQMLTQHEKLKLLKGIDHSRNVSAAFFPSKNSDDHSHPLDNMSASTTDNNVLNSSNPAEHESLSFEDNQKAIVNAAEPSAMSMKGRPVQFATTTTTTTTPPQPNATQGNVTFEDVDYLPQSQTIQGDRINHYADDGTSDRFIVSIPKTKRELQMQSTAAGQSGEADTESLAFDIPVTMFSLRRGFLGTLYRTYLRPSLISTLESVFKVKLTNPCGIMDFDRLDLTAIANANHLDLQIGRNELRKYLHNVVVHSRLDEGERDVIEYEGLSPNLPQKTRLKVAQLLKWIKDEVFLRGCMNLLTTLLGRSPTMSELAFALGYNNPTKLETLLAVCNAYTQWCFEGLATPMGEIILLKLESDWGIEREAKDKEGPLELLDPHMCNTQAVVSTVLWRRMCSIHLNTLASLGNKAVSQLYGAACSCAKHDILKARLPVHMPMGKYRLARRAKATYEELVLLQGRVIQEAKMASERGVTLRDGIYKDDPFVQRVLAVERIYANAVEGTPEACMKEQARHDVLVKEMESRLEVSWNAICEALHSLEVREVGSTTVNTPSDTPTPFKKNPNREREHTYDDMEGPEDSAPAVIRPHSTEYQRDLVLRKSLRMVANEALDDRVARFIFMANLGLFTQGIWSDKELADTLGLSGPEVVNFIFYTARAHCQEYEVWRIKLKLPPYINEARTFPKLVERIELDPNRMPHHLAADVNKPSSRGGRKKTIFFNSESGKPPQPLHPSMKDRYKRLRSIKPRMGTMKESLLNYRKNFASIQRMLEKSPLYYLAEIRDYPLDVGLE